MLRSTDTEVGAKGAFLVGHGRDRRRRPRGGRRTAVRPARRHLHAGSAASTALYADLYADFLAVRDTTAGSVAAAGDAAEPRRRHHRYRAHPGHLGETLERGSAELTERGGSPDEHPPTRKEHPVTAASWRRPTDGVWVGLDLGTQSVRALAVTGDRHVVGAGTPAAHQPP